MNILAIIIGFTTLMLGIDTTSTMAGALHAINDLLLGIVILLVIIAIKINTKTYKIPIKPSSEQDTPTKKGRCFDSLDY